MFQGAIRSLTGRHQFACFDLVFVDPLTKQLGDMPSSAINMVQRGTGVRSALYFRFENVDYSRDRHDAGVIKDVLTRFLRDLFNNDLADFMPTLGLGHDAWINPDEERLEEIYSTLAQGIWNCVTMSSYSSRVEFGGDRDLETRLHVSFGNSLAFLANTNPHAVYRWGRGLKGTVEYYGVTQHFAFYHSELSAEELESFLTPEDARTLLGEYLGAHAPLFLGLERALRFKD